MCCEPHGSTKPFDHYCYECDSMLDENGEPLDICGYSPLREACPVCGSNPCTGYC